MVDNIKPHYDNVANETYTGNAMAPLNELQQSKSLMSFGSGNLTAGLGMTLNIIDPSATQGGPRAPGLNA